MAGMSRSAASLPEELLVEILARVPYRSLCRFRWSPQNLSGFFYHSPDDLRDMRSLNFSGGSSGRRPLINPSLPFLCGHYEHGFTLVDCCGGLLLLCECFASPTPSDRDYVLRSENLLRLGFDPADPSRFTVSVLVQDHNNMSVNNRGALKGLEVYSSQTGAWTSKQIRWHQRTRLDTSHELVSVFMNGALHLPALYFPTLDDLSANLTSIVTVDMDGEIWRQFIRPHFRHGHHRIGQSRGRLHALQI
ncbi:hypothetical protein VPH35_049823 [Triticum aestivum]